MHRTGIYGLHKIQKEERRVRKAFVSHMLERVLALQEDESRHKNKLKQLEFSILLETLQGITTHLHDEAERVRNDILDRRVDCPVVAELSDDISHYRSILGALQISLYEYKAA